MSAPNVSAEASDDIKEWLALLNAFRADVWGNDHIFKEHQIRPSGSNIRTVEYINLGKHLGAVESFCQPLPDALLLIVREYRDAMATFKSEGSGYANGACILGQPGIGKSCFIVYAVIERLREKQPVAVQVSWTSYQANEYILFSEESVTFHTQGVRLPLKKHVPAVWAFSDSNEDTEIPTIAFRRVSGVRIFQTTSPVIKRWKEWTKQLQVDQYYMNLWSTEEIEDLAFILKYDLNQVELMKALAEKWGPVPRVLRSCVSNPYYKNSYERNLDGIIGVTTDNPSAIIRAILGLDNTPNPGSSAVFFIKPLEEDNTIHRSAFTVFVPTRWLIDKLVVALDRQRVAKKVEFFRTLNVQSTTRSAAGCIFEQIVHEFLVRTRPITIEWYDEQSSQDLQLPSLDTHTTNIDLKKSPPFYWRPGGLNNPGIDGAIITEDTVYVIQCTISRTRTTPQIGVDKLWEIMPPGKRALQWKCLFIGSVEDQTEEVANDWAHCLEFREGMNRRHLPVGRVAVFPKALGSMSVSCSRIY